MAIRTRPPVMSIGCTGLAISGPAPVFGVPGPAVGAGVAVGDDAGRT
jgi:hypothetical protein